MNYWFVDTHAHTIQLVVLKVLRMVYKWMLGCNFVYGLTLVREVCYSRRGHTMVLNFAYRKFLRLIRRCSWIFIRHELIFANLFCKICYSYATYFSLLITSNSLLTLTKISLLLIGLRWILIYNRWMIWSILLSLYHNFITVLHSIYLYQLRWC